MEFTQEQEAHIDQLIANVKKEWTEKELNSVIAERDELMQYKPKTLSDDEKAIQQKQAELLQKEMALLMKEANVSDFADLITANDVEELKSKIGKLNDVLKARKIDGSYVPNDHKQTTDKYSQYEKNNDVVGMIGTKLEKLFK